MEQARREVVILQGFPKNITPNLDTKYFSLFYHSFLVILLNFMKEVRHKVLI